MRVLDFGALGDPVGERGTLDQLHHERGDPATVLEAVDAGDVRVVERREDFRFALEADEPILIVRE